MAYLSLTNLCCKNLYAYSVPFMSEKPTPSDSIHPRLGFIIHARMMTASPAESSAPMTSVEQGTEEMVMIESEEKEFFSTLVKNKGKEHAGGSGKPSKPTKWAGRKPHTCL